MKSFIVVALLVAAAVAAPAGREADARIVEQKLDNIGVGLYEYIFKTENNIEAQERGQIENEGTPEEGQEVVGRYSYQGDDGNIYEVVYKAGKNGFEPQGAHIPRGPVVA